MAITGRTRDAGNSQAMSTRYGVQFPERGGHDGRVTINGRIEAARRSGRCWHAGDADRKGGRTGMPATDLLCVLTGLFLSAVTVSGIIGSPRLLVNIKPSP